MGQPSNGRKYYSVHKPWVGQGGKKSPVDLILGSNAFKHSFKWSIGQGSTWQKSIVLCRTLYTKNIIWSPSSMARPSGQNIPAARYMPWPRSKNAWEYSVCGSAELKKYMRIFGSWLGRAPKIYENIWFMARPRSKNRWEYSNRGSAEVKKYIL